MKRTAAIAVAMSMVALKALSQEVELPAEDHIEEFEGEFDEEEEFHDEEDFEENEIEEIEFDIDEHECGLYLADTVDERTGDLTMGIFAARDIDAGRIVGVPDLVIPLLDDHDDDYHREQKEDLWWLWDDYLWDPLDVGGIFEGRHVKSAVMGVGSMARGHSDHSNVIMLASNWDDADMDRSQDLGAGAISYYNGATIMALEDIDAGSEILFPGIFRSFDNNVEEETPRNGMSVDDPRVQEFWRKYDELQAKHGAFLSSERKSQLWGILQESSKSSTSRLLPKSWTDADVVSEHVRNHGRRSPEWLKEHGICIDNIRQGPAVQEGAGRGAHATRDMSEGQVIAPAPVVHVTDAHQMHMHVSGSKQNLQLLTNYCFAHSDSSKLFCPVGAATSFINHSPTPNSYLRWSSKSKQAMFDLPADELVANEDPYSLILEFVALRPIAMGEEVTVDYGKDWERAWQEHKERWSPAQQGYVSAAEFNHLHAFENVRTESEENLETTYPINLRTGCVYEHIADEDAGEYQHVEGYEGEVLVKPFFDVEDVAYEHIFLRPCRVIQRILEGEDDETVDYSYRVEIMNADYVHDDQWLDETLIVDNVPRHAIKFIDQPFTSDQSMENAFRHPMMLPDDIFPESWKNLKV